MSGIIDKVSDGLARPTPRKGFLRVVGMGLVGGAAAAAGAGGALLSGQGPRAALATLACCSCSQSGCSTVYCGQDTCLSTEYTVDGPSCCIGGTGAYYDCYDCLSKPSRNYVCTYGVFVSSSCPQSPSRNSQTSGQSSAGAHR